MKLLFLLILTPYTFAQVYLSEVEISQILKKTDTYPSCLFKLTDPKTRTINGFCLSDEKTEEFRLHNFRLYFYKKTELMYTIPYAKPVIRYSR